MCRRFIADLKQVEEVRAFETSQQSEAQRLVAAVSGRHYQGPRRLDGLRKTLTWTRRLRESLAAAGGQAGALPAAPDELIQQATRHAPPVRDCARHSNSTEQALHNVEVRFEAPGPVLDGRPLREHGPDEVSTTWRNCESRSGRSPTG